MPTTSYDRYFQPVILLTVDGQDGQDLVHQMGKFEVNESSRRNVEVKITFNAFDPATDFSGTLMTDPRCQPGADWRVKFGYLDNLSEEQGFRLSHFEPEFAEDGSTSLVLYLQTRGAVMARDRRSYQWGNVNSSDIAARIAERYGFALDSEESNDRRGSGHGYTQPGTMSDLQYLISLANRIHYVCYVDGNILHYHRPNMDESPRMELGWYAGQPAGILQSVKPVVRETRADRAAHAGEGGTASSTTGGTDSTHGGTIVPLHSQGSYIVDHRSLSLRPDTSVAPTPDPATTDAAVTPTAEQDHSTRQRHAEARRRLMLARSNECNIRCLGEPRLRRDMTISLTGLPPQLVGSWYVEESTHTLGDDGSYITEAKLHRGAYTAHPRTATATTTTTGSQTTTTDVDAGSARGTIGVRLGARTVFEDPPKRPE